MALDVPMEDLLGHEDELDDMQGAAERVSLPRRSPDLYDWVPSEGGPLAMPSLGNFRALSPGAADDLRFSVESAAPAKTNGHDSIYLREGELMSKLHDLLHSPIGESVARIVEELHVSLPRSRPSM